MSARTTSVNKSFKCNVRKKLLIDVMSCGYFKQLNWILVTFHKLYPNSALICCIYLNKKCFSLFAILSFFSDMILYMLKKIEKKEKTQFASKSV